jgi:hypothetical protein
MIYSQLWPVDIQGVAKERCRWLQKLDPTLVNPLKVEEIAWDEPSRLPPSLRTYVHVSTSNRYHEG